MEEIQKPHRTQNISSVQKKYKSSNQSTCDGVFRDIIIVKSYLVSFLTYTRISALTIPPGISSMQMHTKMVTGYF